MRSRASRTSRAAAGAALPTGSAGRARGGANLSVYSNALTPRNAVPKHHRRRDQNDLVCGAALVCAERTASAIVSELTIRTTVLTAPQRDVQVVAGVLEPLRRRRRGREVGHEQPAEEHDLGDQEHPHAERGRLGLLLHVVEVVLQPDGARASVAGWRSGFTGGR